MTEPTIKDIREAHGRIERYVHNTPVLTCSTLDGMSGAELFFKCENFQKTGSFKIRGAANAVFSLSDKDASRGVATHSSGNHAAALALAAGWRGIKAHVVMPENSSSVKRDAAAGYGAGIVFCKPTLEAREQGLSEVVDNTGAVFIHPYNEYGVISGQGTAALELIKEIPDLDAVLVPVGGGGLLSGTALCVTAVSPGTKVIAVEPERADDAYRSFHAGRLIPAVNPDTIADGLRTSLGGLTFPIIIKYVEDIVTVSEEGIVAAMRCIWERMKIIVEPSAAVTLAALLTERIALRERRIGIIISGGNVDLSNLPWNS